MMNITLSAEPEIVKEARAYMHVRDAQLDQAEVAPAFEVGSRVKHPVFGMGTIVGIDSERSAYEVHFDGMDTPRSLAMRAQLEQA